MKRIALLMGAVALLGVFASPALADCTMADVHNAVAQWANVPLSEVTDTTQLDGLGGKSWPQDAPPLIADVEQMCGCQIPQEEYETFDNVGDIDGGAGADDWPEE